jgi:xanthine dehydrogenase accessory factor
LTHLLEEGKPAVLCTLIQKKGSSPRNEGAKMLIDPEGNTRGTIGGGGIDRRLVDEALKALKDNHSRTLTFTMGVKSRGNSIVIDSKCGGEVSIFLDVIRPDPRLIIVGSGHVAKSLAQTAHMVGFKVILVDDAKTASRNRFPQAQNILSGPLEEELKKIDVGPSDYIAVVHGETDYELIALRFFLMSEPAYIGLLGSENKAIEHKTQLLEEGFPRRLIENISAPIGVDIGAETPEEIAISIMAEIIKTKHQGKFQKAF